MSNRPRRSRSRAVNANVALVAMEDLNTPAELAQQYDVNTDLTNEWRARLLEGAPEMFGAETAAAPLAVFLNAVRTSAE